MFMSTECVTKMPLLVYRNNWKKKYKKMNKDKKVEQAFLLRLETSIEAVHIMFRTCITTFSLLLLLVTYMSPRCVSCQACNLPAVLLLFWHNSATFCWNTEKIYFKSTPLLFECFTRLYCNLRRNLAMRKGTAQQFSFLKHYFLQKFFFSFLTTHVPVI